MKQWFAAKTYGFGWTPITWQAWLAVFLVIVDVIFTGLSLTFATSVVTVALSVAQAAIAVLLLIGLSYATGPSPKWRWGK